MKLEKTNQFKVVEIYFAKIIINNKLSQVVQDVDKAFFSLLFFFPFLMFSIFSFLSSVVGFWSNQILDLISLVLDKK